MNSILGAAPVVRGLALSGVCALVLANAIPGAGAADIDCAGSLHANGRVAEVGADTTLLLRDGGSVRLAGILPAFPAAQAPGARQALAALAKGYDAELRFASKSAGEADRHGRRAGQVFVKQPGGTIWLQGALVLQGLARVHVLKSERECAAELLARERRARAAQAGYWRTGHFAVHDVRAVAQLDRLLDTFQIVEGRVLSVGERKRTTYLNFGPVWKEDFTVIVSADIAARLAEDGSALGALAGARVRVRGYLQRRGGPAIIVETPEQIEFLERN